jgi:hypothetical protein
MGKKLTIILEPTGERNEEKGYDYLGVNIPDIGAMYIKAKDPNQVGQAQTVVEIDTSDDESDIPF